VTLLHDLLAQRARETPRALAYGFVQGEDDVVEALDHASLFDQAAALAALLQRRFAPQSRLLLVAQSPRRFVIAFFACLMSGMVAVPTALPRRQALAERLRVLVEDARAAAALTDADALLQFAATPDAQGLPCLDLRTVHAADEARAADWRRPADADAPLAFLQYTSGSTGRPKGVMVTHGNLRHNSALIREAMDLSEASAVLTALPMFHDMGLVGGLMQPMVCGCPGYWMTPAEFVQFPERWLRRIGRFSITTSGGPNFMFDLAARQVDAAALAREGVDLSRWSVAFCGAEPVRASTAERFCERFAPLGFDVEAFYPCYGMAEATLFITGKPLAGRWRQSRAQGTPVVSCGVPRGDTRVRIVEAATARPVDDGAVGEIWVRGASVAAGYWGREDLDGQGFAARLTQDPAEAADATDAAGTWLRTGDLGYLEDGELYVTGRSKDVLIVRGRKVAPQDVEDAASGAHAALREAGGAAFAVPRGDGQSLVLVCELQREALRRPALWPEAVSAARAAVRRAHDVVLDDVVLLRPGSLPRTSSGKVMRAECRARYLAGGLERATVPSELADLPASSS
jgi:acyl-CoA synthetase (AMP-forming)/AMP-acid ligase II